LLKDKKGKRYVAETHAGTWLARYFQRGPGNNQNLPDDIKEAVKVADDLMYSVKIGEKNNIAYKLWHDKS